MDHTLVDKILIAMPSLKDPRFERSIVYMCVHSDEGAMGLILNKAIGDLSFSDLIEQLSIEPSTRGIAPSIDVQFGGPCEMGRGFVLHSSDYDGDESTVSVSDTLSLTGSIDILRDIAAHRGPEHAILALGYAGWSAGQLESEFRRNDWLCCDADDDLIFSESHSSKWSDALRKIGVAPEFLAYEGGQA